MELSQLRYFLAVANCGQIARAASMLHVSQSAISMSIARLEKELGVKLFDRSPRAIALSARGKVFLDMITPAIAELDFAQQQITALDNDAPDIIALSVEIPDFATIFERIFCKLHPHIRFRQSMDTTEQTRQKLLCKLVDFVLTFEPFTAPEVESILLLEEPALIQLSSRHPQYQEESIWLSTLEHTPFVSFSTEYSFRRWTDGMCYLAGFRPYICSEVCDTQSLMSIVYSNNAAAFIGKSTWESNIPSALYPTINDCSVRAIPLLDASCVRTVYLSFNKTRILSPAAESFLLFAHQFQAAYAKEPSFPKIELQLSPPGLST